MQAPPPHILLLCDDAGEARRIREMLEEEPSEVPRLTHAKTLPAAMEVLEREKVELLLLDLAFTVGEGLDPLSMVKKSAPMIPIVALCTQENEPLARRAVQAGVQDCLAKANLDGRSLLRAARFAIERSRLQNQAEENLRRLAYEDQLTHLPNRVSFTDRLRRAIREARRNPEFKFAVLFLDFDRFKIINDSMGHEVGDQLLVRIAERLRGSLRATDIVSHGQDGHLAARLGGDEFVVLLDGIRDVRDALLVAERIQKELSAPHFIAGHEIISTASIGIVASDKRYVRPEQLIRDADIAMYQAKAAGRARHVVFDEKMHQDVLNRLRLEEGLRHANEKRQFTLHYQPIIELQSGCLVGFEALIRWRHPDLGLVSPGEFIPLAEEIGLIVPIGRWVLREACSQLKSWHDRFPSTPPLTVNVNLSGRELADANLIATIRQALDETGADPRSLRLEIPEKTMMDDMKRQVTVLHEIRKLGVRLCLDDFGSGHSSISCLHRFPIDMLKIDQMFIDNMGAGIDYAAVIHAIITLAHNLNMSVVATGVESGDVQVAQLQALQCDYAQGFFFSETLAADAADAFIAGALQREGAGPASPAAEEDEDSQRRAAEDRGEKRRVQSSARRLEPRTPNPLDSC
ncbi:MAG: EAL domain-containing protein [Planctomycetes bacterium]|nr:EAL domain-containing protein [Planctomycetota bacterium]